MPRLLLVTLAYPPSRQIGGRRMHRFATGLAARGWDVTVLCPQPRYMQPLDPPGPPDPGVTVVHTAALVPRVWLEMLAAKVTRKSQGPATPQQVDAPTAPSLGRKLRSAVGKGLRQVEFPDAYVGWLGPALTALRGQHFDVVFASSPPQTALLAGAGLAARLGARLVLDYRDPWAELMSPDGRYGHERPFPAWERRLHTHVEDRVLQRADLVLGVTPRICTWLRPRTRAEVVLLPNSLDRLPPNPPPPRESPARLVYAGSLAYERSLDSVLAAMAALRSQWGPDALRLTYAGPHGAQLRTSAAQFGVADQLDDHGVLSHKQTLALYSGAAAGIVSVSARTDYSYPGKLFEILAAGCPVLLCGPQTSEAALLVQELRAGVVDDGEDAQQSAALLRNLLTQAAPTVDLAPWHAPARVAELDGLLRGLIG